MAHKKYDVIVKSPLIKYWDKNKNDIEGLNPENLTLGATKEVYWICDKCGYSWKESIFTMNRKKNKCPCCYGSVVVSGINDLTTTHPQVAKMWHPKKNNELKPNQFRFGSEKRVWWMCEFGHEWEASINSVSRSKESIFKGCPICAMQSKTSFPEQAIFFYLIQKFPEIKNRYIIDKNIELDIYIPELKIGIEYDGVRYHGKDRINREIKKYEICRERGIKLIRIKEIGECVSGEKTSDVVIYTQYKKNKLEHLNTTIENVLEIVLNSNDKDNFDIDVSRDNLEICKLYVKHKVRNSFKEKCPEMIKFWDYDKNKELRPEYFSWKSSQRVWWKCPECGYEWKSSIFHRSYGSGCPQCEIRKNINNKRKPIIATTMNGEKMLFTKSIVDMSVILNINKSQISLILRGKCKSVKGKMRFIYASEEEVKKYTSEMKNKNTDFIEIIKGSLSELKSC